LYIKPFTVESKNEYVNLLETEKRGFTEYRKRQKYVINEEISRGIKEGIATKQAIERIVKFLESK
jgi:hypothetical protein